MIEKQILQDMINWYLWMQEKSPSSGELPDDKWIR